MRTDDLFSFHKVKCFMKKYIEYYAFIIIISSNFINIKKCFHWSIKQQNINPEPSISKQPCKQLQQL